VGLVALLALPQLLAGPDLMADDFVWVRNGEFLGVWEAGGARQSGRPGAWLLYGLTFGVVGNHPLLLTLVQIGLWCVAALALLACLRAFFGPSLALVVTVFWLVVPSHTTLELWASTSQAWVAVALLAEGTRRVLRSSSRASLVIGAVCLVAAGGFYEVALGAVPVCVVIADRVRRGRFRWQAAGIGLALAMPALLWSRAVSTVYPVALRAQDGLVGHLAGSVALGLPTGGVLVRVVSLTLAVAATGAAALGVQRSGWTVDRAMVLAGGAIVVAGTAPAVRAYLPSVGIGNRLTAVSGIGAALLWVGAWRIWAPSIPVLTRRGLVTAVVVVLLGVRVVFVGEWLRLGEEARDTARDVAATIRAEGGTSLVLPEPPVGGDWAYGLLDGWNTTAAAQLAGRDPTLVVEIDRDDCVRSGPTPDRPLAQFGEVRDRVVTGCRPR
jgi:hypothetical protein